MQSSFNGDILEQIFLSLVDEALQEILYLILTHNCVLLFLLFHVPHFEIIITVL